MQQKMKRVSHKILLPLLLILAIFTAVAPAGAFEIGSRKIAVSNNGDLKFFPYGDIQKAIDSAAPNDTVFVPEGVFSGITIRKGIVLLGSGQESIINGNIVFAPADTKLNAVIDGLKIVGDLCTDAPTRGLWIRMCEFNNIYFTYYPWYDIIIERCNILEEFQQISFDGCQNVTVYNSKINSIYGNGTNNSISYVNCKIDSANGGDVNGSFINTVFNNNYNGGNSYNCFLQNCLVRQEPSSSTLIRDSWVCGSDPEWKNALDNLGEFIGTDGTMIGPDGGNFPYTLNPSLPTVKERKVSVDYANQTINIELKLSGAPEGTPENSN